MFRVPRSLKKSLPIAFGMVGAVGLLIGIGCAAESQGELPDRQKQFVGRWKKASTSQCSEAYPDHIEFRDTYTYTGRKGEMRREFTLWDAGEYQVLSENQVRISTATDAELVYEYTISKARLIFVDPEGCEFEYQRAD